MDIFSSGKDTTVLSQAEIMLICKNKIKLVKNRCFEIMLIEIWSQWLFPPNELKMECDFLSLVHYFLVPIQEMRVFVIRGDGIRNLNK